MQATRMLQQRALSQLAKNTAANSKNGALMMKAATTSASAAQTRALSTQAVTPDEAYALLNSQRRVRPSSPHFTIYEPQLSWLSSIANRVTGTALSAGIYAGAIAYVAAPAVGLGFDAASIISLFGSFPVWAKIFSKTLVGAPFWFHTWNGMRHLSWDIGYFLELKKSWQAGYAVIGLTAVSTLATAVLI